MKSRPIYLFLLAVLPSPMWADSILSNPANALQLARDSDARSLSSLFTPGQVPYSISGGWLGDSAISSDFAADLAARDSFAPSKGWEVQDRNRWDRDNDADHHDRDRWMSAAPVPEPESFWLFLAGLLVVAFGRFLRRPDTDGPK